MLGYFNSIIVYKWTYTLITYYSENVISFFILFINILTITDDAEMFTSEMHDPYARLPLPARGNNTEKTFKGHRCGAGQTPSEG